MGPRNMLSYHLLRISKQTTRGVEPPHASYCELNVKHKMFHAMREVPLDKHKILSDTGSRRSFCQ